MQSCSSFFFNDTATTEIYTLSLHDALPIYRAGAIPGSPPPDARPATGGAGEGGRQLDGPRRGLGERPARPVGPRLRSEEHTSELQLRQYLVCRLLLEKKKNKNMTLHFERTN